MYLLASANIKGCECICIQWLVSAHTVYLACINKMSMSLHFGFYQELSIHPHFLVCIESWACVCMCLKYRELGVYLHM